MIDGPTTELSCKCLTLQLDDFLVEATKSLSRIFELEAAKASKNRMFRECRAGQRAPKDTVQSRRKAGGRKRLARERFDDATEPIFKAVLARDEPRRPGHKLVGRIERSRDACTAVTNREIPN